MISDQNRDKIKKIDDLLEQRSCFVHVDTSHSKLRVPEHLKKGPSLTLHISRNFRGALEMHADYIEAHLLFNEDYFECQIPYDCIWGATGEEGDNLMWPESLNTKIMLHLIKTRLMPSKGAKKEKSQEEDVVKEESKGDQKKVTQGKTETKKGGHLKRVK